MFYSHLFLQELLINIDPLLAWGIKRPNSPFDTRQQAALRMGDMKLVTGPRVLGSWYKPTSIEGKLIAGYTGVNFLYYPKSLATQHEIWHNPHEVMENMREFV